MKEEKSIRKCLETFLNGYKGDFEILVSIPDEPTYVALLDKAVELGIEKKIFRSEISKSGKALGKPFELNELMNIATGDIWFFGDGDTYFGKNTINILLEKFQENPGLEAITGRPISMDKKDNFFGYIGHLLADGAHFKRDQELTQRKGFFPLSGYLFAMKKSDIRLPKDCLSDDAFISYKLLQAGKQIGYQPEAKVYIKYATNFADFFKQKKRSAGGFVQLKKYGVMDNQPQTRSFVKEVEMALFPLKYAKNLQQFMWSLELFPVRIWLWMMIFWEQKVVKKSFDEVWKRVESTK
jgi:cellulose synthase/poly-beta-1,6-N-acetylglucosamine synthase-like glycosyltransferase